MNKDWCKHYTGILGPGVTKKTHCAASVAYESVKGHNGHHNVYPCFEDEKAEAPACDSRVFPTAEEIAEDERRARAHTEAMLKAIEHLTPTDPGCTEAAHSWKAACFMDYRHDRKPKSKRAKQIFRCRHCGAYQVSTVYWDRTPTETGYSQREAAEP